MNGFNSGAVSRVSASTSGMRVTACGKARGGLAGSDVVAFPNPAGIKFDDVDLFLFHQANLRINEAVIHALGIPSEKCPSNIQRYGNCSAASIPMLLDEAARGGQLEPGKIVAMTAFGSGFTWGSVVLRW